MRCAAIDLGTNTCLCLIADVGADVVAVEDHARIVRLGQGLDATGQLADAAMERTRVAFREVVARAAALHCDEIVGVGTEALRKAGNGAPFVDELRALVRAHAPTARFDIIDGETEARLSWRAVRAAFPHIDGVRTVVDIGGGSTELMVGAETVDEVISLPIGSVRLRERLLAGDPPSADERQKLIATIDAALDGAPRPRGPLVGIAGTVTTLSTLALGLAQYDAAQVHGSRLTLGQVSALVDKMAITTHAELRQWPGLEPGRADVIFAGGTILERILRRTDASTCVVSDRGIRWGLLYERAGLGGS